MHQNTTAIHGADEDGFEDSRPLVTPIYQTSTYAYDVGAEDSGDLDHTVRYMRYQNTPQHEALGAKLAALEGAEAGLVTASGMAAISTVLLSQLRAGDHVLVQDSLYGGTFGLITKHLTRFGIEHTFFDPTGDPAKWESLVRPTTRLVHIEALSNPLVRVPRLKDAVAFARRHGLVSTIDATFATPMHLRAIEHGIDIVMHSATKYLGGHSDLCAGVIAGSAANVDLALRTLQAMGGSLDPNSMFLLDRGLKTLHVRMDRHDANAKALAAHLARHPEVAAVHHPSLVELGALGEPYAGFGGMFAFELAAGSPEAFFQSVEVATYAGSLGGTETLVISPAKSSHAGLNDKELAAAGISPRLIRVSAGLEYIDDLITDFDRAIAAATR